MSEEEAKLLKFIEGMSAITDMALLNQLSEKAKEKLIRLIEIQDNEMSKEAKDKINAALSQAAITLGMNAG